MKDISFEWLASVKLPLKDKIAIALIAFVLLSLELLNLPLIGQVTAYAQPVLIVIALAFTILSIADISEWAIAPFVEERRRIALSARRAVRLTEEVRKRDEHRALVLERLNHLSPQEIRLVANCLRDRSPSFYTYVNDPAASLLLGKSLIWTPGTPHHQDHYPFCIQDFVWAALLDRKEAFVTKDEENRRIKAARECIEGRRYGH